MLKSMLISIMLCAVATVAQAQNAMFWQSLAVQQQTQNQMLQIQMQQMGMRQQMENLANSGPSENPCDPEVLRRPGLHLLSRMGLCDQRRAKAVAPERVAERPTTKRRYEVVAQPREVPPMHNGPMSVYDRPYPYYRGY
jgi:hypothetical protein